jgi:hypothetical protein
MRVKIKTRGIETVQPNRDASGANIEVACEMSLLDMKETISEFLKVVPGPQWNLWLQDFEKE